MCFYLLIEGKKDKNNVIFRIVNMLLTNEEQESIMNLYFLNSSKLQVVGQKLQTN